MKSYFYNQAPKIFIIIAIFYTLMGYSIDKIAQTKTELAILGIFMLLVNVSGGIVVGKLLQKSYMTSLTDSLTKVYNRRHFYNKLKQEIKNLQSSLSLLMIDVDDFKKVNDTYGHPEGDSVLIEICEILKQNIRACDTLARLGGEEFAIIVPNTNDAGVSVFAERVKKVIEEHDFSLKGDSCHITVSIGIFTTYKYIDKNLLIKYADDAMYAAKQTKNCVVDGTTTANI